MDFRKCMSVQKRRGPKTIGRIPCVGGEVRWAFRKGFSLLVSVSLILLSAGSFGVVGVGETGAGTRVFGGG